MIFSRFCASISGGRPGLGLAAASEGSIAGAGNFVPESASWVPDKIPKIPSSGGVHSRSEKRDDRARREWDMTMLLKRKSSSEQTNTTHCHIAKCFNVK